MTDKMADMRTSALSLALLLVSVMPSIAQTQAAPQAVTPRPDLAALADGWSHLAAGRYAEAMRIGETLLASAPDAHRAMAFLVEVELARSQPIAALDRYEAWLGAQRPDDPYTLAQIAVGVARILTETADPLVQAEARAIIGRLDQAPPTTPDAPPGALGDAALARAGNPEAMARLRERLGTPMGPEAEYVIGALADAGDRQAIPALTTLLSAPQLPLQAAAATALGRLGATAAMPQLRTLAASRRPLVSPAATIALARLGDPDARDAQAKLLESPNGEERLMAAEAMGPQDSARWAPAISALLGDQSLMLRIQAALVLTRAGVDVEKAQTVLAQALNSENPVLREQAGQAFTTPEAATPQLLRRLLRDGDPRVQLRGVQGLLALTRR